MFKFGREKWPETLPLNLSGAQVDVQLRVHPRARHYRLSVPAGGQPMLTVPPHGGMKEATKFLLSQANWLDERLKKQPTIVHFIDGAVVPLRGEEYLLVMQTRLRGGVNIVEDRLEVPGGREHMARRLKDWLKREARADLEKQVLFHANNLGVQAGAISIRSQSSRWGSCASSGKLNFNWRLILAPSFVLDYVAAHEVAHILEMNHSPAFWANVEQTLPDMARGRAWLKANGQGLMVYGT